MSFAGAAYQPVGVQTSLHAWGFIGAGGAFSPSLSDGIAGVAHIAGSGLYTITFLTQYDPFKAAVMVTLAGATNGQIDGVVIDPSTIEVRTFNGIGVAADRAFFLELKQDGSGA